MTDTTAANGQDPEAADAAQDATTQGSGQDSQPTGFDALPPETQKEIKALRKEAATYRKRAEEYESRNLTELEKRDAALKAAEDRATQLETRLRDLSARSAVTDAAAKANAKHPTLIYRAVKDDLAFDDEGNVTNVDAVLKALKAEAPDLFPAANGSADGGKGNGQATSTQSINDVFREMARTAT